MNMKMQLLPISSEQVMFRTVTYNKNNNKTCNAHMSTLLGVQGTVKPKTKQRKTDTTKLVLCDMR